MSVVDTDGYHIVRNFGSTKLWQQDDKWARMERQQGELESEKLGSVVVT